MTLTHYIIVRRDMLLGDVVAQVAHAAGESYYKFAKGPSSSGQQERPVFNGKVEGSNPSLGSMFPGSSDVERRESGDDASQASRGANFDPSNTIVIVLGARNQSRLAKLERELVAAGIPHVAIRETDGGYAGQLMSIGLLPTLKEFAAPYLREFHMIRECAAVAEGMI